MNNKEYREMIHRRNEIRTEIRNKKRLLSYLKEHAETTQTALHLKNEINNLKLELQELQ